ncbi:DEAD/DEAH box helicase [Streptomyces sp. NPDC048172]|uniref:DEAD/DEAH box helicase n=1 Tax=Streptomyces sp. NPDC048172 TaxID=3365505 RepID=UPI0037159E7F
MSKHEHRERQPQRSHAPEVRHEHGGMPRRPDDDELARRTEAERAAAGLGTAGLGPAGRATEGVLPPEQWEARRARRPYPPTRYGP